MIIPATSARLSRSASPVEARSTSTASASSDSGSGGDDASETTIAIVVSILGVCVLVGLAVAWYLYRGNLRLKRREGYPLDRSVTGLSEEPINREELISRENTPSPALSTATGIDGSRRPRPNLRVVTRSASIASRLSTEVVVRHADDGGSWAPELPLDLVREPGPPPGHRIARKPSERNAEGRRIVSELIPPPYDPTWPMPRQGSSQTPRFSRHILEEPEDMFPMVPASHIP